ncbi:hypothetical protein AAC387_Pa05g0759 [Persea americana]
MKWHMRGCFLPPNYVQALYQHLQSLLQREQSVDDYTKVFHYLVVRNNVKEDEEQLVARYLHGIRPAMQDALAVHPLWTVTEAYQQALAIENVQKKSHMADLDQPIYGGIRDWYVMVVMLGVVDNMLK